MSTVKKWSRKKTAAQKEKKAIDAPDLRVRLLSGETCLNGGGGGGGECAAWAAGFELVIRCFNGRWNWVPGAFGNPVFRRDGLGGIVEGVRCAMASSSGLVKLHATRPKIAGSSGHLKQT